MSAPAAEYAESSATGVLAGDGAALLRLTVDEHHHRSPGRFVAERTVTDLATVRAFLGWAGRHLDVSALRPLAEPQARIAPQHLPAVVWQATHASAVCRARREQGLAVFSAERVGVVRGFATVNGPVEILDDGTLGATAHPDGITLRTDDLDVRLDIREWTLDGDTATLRTAEGTTTVTDAAVAGILRTIAPGVEHGVLRRAPLTRLFAPLFVAVPEMARRASVAHTALMVDRVDPLPAG